MDTKAVMLGTDNYHAVMQQMARASLQHKAGYVPGVMDEPMPEPVGKLGTVVALAGDTVELDYVARWCQGRAWLAGSAALWRYEFSRLDMGTSMEWNYHDIDVFAMSDAAYESLYSEMENKGCDLVTGTDNHAVFDGFAIDREDETIYIYDDINLVRPMKGQSWEHPANIFKTFDLSICQVALGAGWAYLQHPDDVQSKTISYGKGRNAIFLLERVMKYLRRGYALADDFLSDVLADEKCSAAVMLLSDLADCRQYASAAFDKLLLDAENAVSHSESYELDWDDIDVISERDDDDYDDEGDWSY